MHSNNEKPFTWLKTGKEIVELGITEVPTLLKPLIAKVGVMALAGSSDLGKSYLLLQLMVAIIKGLDSFLGFKLETLHKRVAYLSTEDDEYSLCPRLLNMIREDGDVTNFDNLMILFETKDLIQRLDQLLTVSPCDLVVIDTFSDIYDGDMNQSNKVRSFLQPFKELANRHKTMFIFNHHCGKRNDQRPPHKDNLLGSQGFESSMRTVLELRKDFLDPQKRHLCVVKGNYIGEEYKSASYELEFDFQSGFTATGGRVSFDLLVKNSDAPNAEAALERRILELRATGLSISKIHETLAQEGVKVSRGKVGAISKESLPSIRKAIDEKMDGQRGEPTEGQFQMKLDDPQQDQDNEDYTESGEDEDSSEEAA